MLGTAANATPALAWQALPYVLHQGLAPGDTHMGVRLLGAVELPRTRVDGIELVELSGLGYDADNDIVYVLSDRGALFQMRLVLSDGALVGVDLLEAHALRDAAGGVLSGSAADAEGLAVLEGRNGRVDDTVLLVSFERQPRLAEYQPNGSQVRALGLPAGLQRQDFSGSNRGLESVMVAGPLGILTAPEKPLRGEPGGIISLLSMDGRRWRYPLYEERSAVVAMEWIGEDTALVLERDLDLFFYRIVTRLRLVSGLAESSASDTLQVRDIAAFDSGEGWRVDNFEGLTRLTGERYLMVSDDNESVLQRTLLVLFERLPGRDARSAKFEPLQDAGR